MSLYRLSEFQSDLKASHYLVVKQIRKKVCAYALSPAVMWWDEITLIIDLKSCERYWRFQAKKHHVSYLKILETVLSGEFVASLCQHPWQGLLLIPLLGAHRNHIVPADSPHAQNLLHSLTWDQWLDKILQLHRHLKELKLSKEPLSPFVRQLQNFVKRMNLGGPLQLHQADRSAMSKRFGKTVGMAWDWTFSLESLPLFQRVVDLKGFPWIPTLEEVPVCVGRDLEYPLNDWQHIEPLLQEDLLKLSQQFPDQDRVCRMEWELTLYHMQVIVISLVFRNPYHLHGESPDFVTALQQAQYGFQKFLLDLQKRDQDLDLPETIPLVSWKLSLCERLRIPQEVLSFFTDTKKKELQDILELENKLPVPLENYELVEGFLPQEAHRPSGEAEKKTVSAKVWRYAGLLRPLFLHPEPRLGEPMGRRQFLEQASANWWCDSYEVQGFYCFESKKQMSWWGLHERWEEYGVFD